MGELLEHVTREHGEQHDKGERTCPKNAVVVRRNATKHTHFTRIVSIVTRIKRTADHQFNGDVRLLNKLLQ
jgi:hypothetical protein